MSTLILHEFGTFESTAKASERSRASCSLIQSASMKWSNEVPTAAWLYWFRGRFIGDTDTPEIVFEPPTILEITQNGMGLHAQMMGKHWWRLAGYHR